MLRVIAATLTLLLLVTMRPARAADEPAANIKADFLDGSVLRYRVETVTPELSHQFAQLVLPGTNVPAGLVLDLRYASGDRSGADAGFDFFSTNHLPLVVLISGHTDAAGAALASRLRTAGRGLILGSPQASPSPDLTVEEAGEAEKRWFSDPYLTLTNRPVLSYRSGRFSLRAPNTSEGTNDWSAFVDHTSEADLVRKHVKDGDDSDDSPDSPRIAPPPVIQDPVLARAVDLLKGWAALHPARG
jgi:hypothetical protein